MSVTYKLKEYFLGSNTCRGFYSRHQQLFKKGYNRFFIIKGGPGTGKSTLFRTVCQGLVKEGYSVELYCCASDNRSLDGLCVPSLGVVMVDGTYPHVIDPELPGVRDEIINLGSYWNEDILKNHFGEIQNYRKEISTSFDIAYRYLKEAKIAYEQWQFFFNHCINVEEAVKSQNSFITEIFDEVRRLEKLSEEQRLLASAITPEGPVNKYDLILQDIKNFHLLLGEPGTGKSTLLKHIYLMAQRKGLNIEAYHCGFDPQRLDAIVLPEISTAVIKHCYPHNFCLSDIKNVNKVSTFDLSLYIDQGKIRKFNIEIQDTRERFWNLIKLAVKNIERARICHGKLEKYYSSAQNFNELDRLTEQLLQKTLQYSVH
ncbi:hypothetical protein [Candidatus Contubernalis alkaliaceticus]|uniref:hypothetical protein n=1 Tax=Candidatus Contubernalis alkaliaceticus TaxID=338645 RepID=UPI001F4C43D8|nr:hypothetical protein [Candidatus Contubernalis alkalaceticus]UNC93138.1 hypothetical protein HUE98_14195 [Candidatus Contubernalis alkalaceticus]